MLGRLLLVGAVVTLVWSASLNNADGELSRSKRHVTKDGGQEESDKSMDSDNVKGPRRPENVKPLGVNHVSAAMVADENCDTGQVNLTMDWDHNPDIYTCQRKETFKPNKNKPIHYCQDKTYPPIHYCTTEELPPNPDPLPVSGPHRPLWPQYGEYKYIPPARYLHGLEHGAIALMYDPCVDKKELQKLKDVLKGCMFRHIISATDLLDEEHPFALLSWGCALLLGHADIELAVAFTKMHGIQTYEFTMYFNGFFNDTLIEHSKMVSDKKDSVLCPQYPNINKNILYDLDKKEENDEDEDEHEIRRSLLVF